MHKLIVRTYPQLSRKRKKARRVIFFWPAVQNFRVTYIVNIFVIFGRQFRILCNFSVRHTTYMYVCMYVRMPEPWKQIYEVLFHNCKFQRKYYIPCYLLSKNKGIKKTHSVIRLKGDVVFFFVYNFLVVVMICKQITILELYNISCITY